MADYDCYPLWVIDPIGEIDFSELPRQFKNETHQPQELTKKGSSGTV